MLGLVQTRQIPCRKTGRLVVCRVFLYSAIYRLNLRIKAVRACLPHRAALLYSAADRSVLTQDVSRALVVHVVTFVSNPKYFNSTIYIGLPSYLVCFTAEHVTSCQLRHFKLSSLLSLSITTWYKREAKYESLAA
jgi:hypothetical protein